MKKLRMGLTVIVFLFVSTLGTANAFLDSNLTKAKKAMKVGEYDTAISLLQEVAAEGDLETNFYLGLAYLMDDDYDMKAKDKFKVIASLDKSYNDRIARAYLNKVARSDNRWQFNRYLIEAEKYCRSLRMKQQVANEILHKRVRNCKKRAARLIGEKLVYGFTRIWKGKTLTITFYTNKPVVVVELLKRGQKFFFTGKKSPMVKNTVKNIFSEYPLNVKITMLVNTPLIIKPEIGEKLVINFI